MSIQNESVVADVEPGPGAEAMVAIMLFAAKQEGRKRAKGAPENGKRIFDRSYAMYDAVFAGRLQAIVDGTYEYHDVAEMADVMAAAVGKEEGFEAEIMKPENKSAMYRFLQRCWKLGLDELYPNT